eukprot:6213465-Pleurochrysis_carterae.AAC.2
MAIQCTVYTRGQEDKVEGRNKERAYGIKHWGRVRTIPGINKQAHLRLTSPQEEAFTLPDLTLLVEVSSFAYILHLAKPCSYTRRMTCMKLNLSTILCRVADVETVITH